MEIMTLSLAALLDDARSSIVELQSPGAVIRLRVPPATFDALVRLRGFDLERGNPLLVLGAEVIVDPSLEDSRFSVDAC